MKRAEYKARATWFRAALVAEAAKPEPERNWPTIDEWLRMPGTSTCTTPACEVFGKPFPVILYENADGIHRGQCGRCLQPTVPVPIFEGE